MSIKQWVEICEDSGIDTTRMGPLDVYLVAGKLIQDDLVTKRALKFLRGAILPAGARLKVIQEMTLEEREALRERVSGKVVRFNARANREEQIARETAKEEAFLQPDDPAADE